LNYSFNKSAIIATFSLLLSGQIVAQDHILPESEYPYWPEYEYLSTGDLDTIEKQPWINNNHIIDGWDWSLPDHIEPSDRGLVGLQRIAGWNKAFQPLNTRFQANGVGILWVNWREIEKTEGNFDFSPLISRIQQANSVGLDIVLRILCHSKSKNGNISGGQAPLWLEDLGVPVMPREKINENFDTSHPVFHFHYLRLVNELKNSGIPHMVKAAYVGYASKSHGDEGIGPYGEKNPEANDTVQHVRERLDAWEEAFEGIEHKVFMGGPSHYGFEKGFGMRKGFVEMYHYRIPDNEIGQYIDDKRYLSIDEEAPVLKNQCFSGEVNEEYNQSWAEASSDYRFGTTTNSFPYRYFMSNLRVLQMRCTYVHTTGHLIPKMLPFISQELGRTAEDTPDAWSFLTETNLKSGLSKNWERWLYQRDAPGYETTPDIKMQHVRKMWMIADNKYYDYIARKGQKMGFAAADDVFPTDSIHDVALKISYYDGVPGTLKLVYTNCSGSTEERTITTYGTDAIKTATFFINAKFDAAGYNFDFELQSTQEVPVSFVRVIKTEPFSSIDVSGLTVTPKTLELEVGQTGQLSKAVHPTNATNQIVSWSSSNSSVATVDNSGLVTAVAEGIATIKVITSDGSYSDECSITVDLLSGNSIMNVISDDIKVYPNPVSKILYFDLPESSSEKHIEIYNSNGQLLIAENTYGDHLEINVEEINTKHLLLINIVYGKNKSSLKVYR